MPIYDYKCPSCNRTKKDIFVKTWEEVVKCKQCKVAMKKLICTGVAAHVFPSGGVFLKHVSAKGHRFHSTGEMRAYEKEHKINLGYLGHA